ncbi:MAG TPA: hypothetical protein ENL03_02800 [Phycisphaerae bacterium]|nr:hypothetical protein [Phycisphaerae bacterium]
MHAYQPDTLSKEMRFRIACLIREKRKKCDLEAWGFFDDQIQSTNPSIINKLGKWWRINELIDEFPKSHEVIPRALLNLSRMVQWPCEYIDGDVLHNHKAPYLLFTPDNQVDSMLADMTSMGYIEAMSSRYHEDVRITPEGWKAVDGWKKEAVNVESDQAFVAMWFDPSMQEFFDEGIKPAIKNAGYKCLRIDEKPHNNDISDEIIAEIRKSRFIVADFTSGECGKCEDCNVDTEKSDNGEVEIPKDRVHPRGGVYYEAGFAKGLGLEVVWIVRLDQINCIHFDNRQMSFVTYETPDELRKKLCARIEATIGVGPNKQS